MRKDLTFLFPRPPQNEPPTANLIGEITGIPSEQYFTLKTADGFDWNIWVNDDTKFHPITDANMNIQEIRLEDLKTGDPCSIKGQIKKPASEGVIGECLATEIRFPIRSELLVEYSIFYSNNIMDPNLLDCNKVHPVKRMANENATYEEILLLLFDGPTDEEKKQGYISAIPDDVVINFIVRK